MKELGAFGVVFIILICLLPTFTIKSSAHYDGADLNDACASQKIIVIDPGHQTQGNTSLEPVSPGSSKMKAKVSSGTKGVKSSVPEYVLTLEIALGLRDELNNRGYKVILTRESNDVNISNSERAMMANESKADVFIRLHANGSDDSRVNGAMTICQTKNNPNNGYLYEESRKLSEKVLSCYSVGTGIKQGNIWETDTMTGINWSQVPTTIIEMGYMTNPEEDEKMQDPLFRIKMIKGIAEGIDNYLKND